MTKSDEPFGGNRTVIRPNPGGLSAGPGGPGRAPAGWPGAESGGFRPTPQRPPVPPPSAAGYGEQSRFGIPQEALDPWMLGGSRQRPIFPTDALNEAPAREAPRIPLDVALNARDHVDVKSSNPLIVAAAPLLILLGRLRLLIVEMQAMPLMQHVTRTIREFEERLLAAGLPRDDVMIAKYALCATADDIVQNLPGADRGVWTQYSMVSQFFQNRTSGVGFFDELDKLRTNPAIHFDLLELMHACLSLGFEGKFRTSEGGVASLQRVRRDVYQTLRNLRPRPDEDLSPRWRGLSIPTSRHRFEVPIWAVGCFVGAALVALFLLLRLLLSRDAELVAETLTGLYPPSPVAIERAAFKPLTKEIAPPSGQLERMRTSLKDDLDAGRAEIERLGDEIVVRIANLVLFEPGKAEVREDFQDMAARIATTLGAEKGQIRIVGHTDNVRLKSTNRFKSNYDLSVARAKSVEALLGPKVADPARFVVEGKGEDEPIADNKTVEGRAMNRRVEIMVPTEESLP